MRKNTHGIMGAGRLVELLYHEPAVKLTFGVDHALEADVKYYRFGMRKNTHGIMGAGRLVELLYHEPAVKLTYLKQTGDPDFPSGDPRDPGDHYTGLDCFGRLQDQRCLGPESSSSSSSSSSSGPEEGAWERVQCGFDRASNRTWRKNLVAPSNQPQDELYSCDGLYKLATFARGILTGDRTELTDTPKAEEEFTYDPQGNWAEYHTAEDGDPTLDQTREHGINQDHSRSVLLL